MSYLFEFSKLIIFFSKPKVFKRDKLFFSIKNFQVNSLSIKNSTFIVEIDPVQMQKLGYNASEAIEFEIQVDEYGDIVYTLEFSIEAD